MAVIQSEIQSFGCNLAGDICREFLFTLGKTDFKTLRKFNGANFYICFEFLSEEPKTIEKIDLAKCPF